VNQGVDEDRKGRTMPICLNAEQLVLLEKFAKKNGMTSYSQAVEFLSKQK
jgi:hypothetical protein